MREIIALSLALAFVCLLSAFSLSFVYQHSKPLIERNREGELREAVEKVLPGAKVEYAPLTSGRVFEALNSSSNLIALYKGEKDGREVYAALISVKGYQGAIRMLIGFDPGASEILGVEILEHAETPGLGSRIEGESFLSQFKGKLKPKYDTITGATISSSAVIRGFVNAMRAVMGGER
ncbi:hypothetical protein DRP77_08115 [Candidatus Poribacteria bacterium]|nr:MAG: hypothetical protein DRP77_08115 [Candidatus Poribacteria bacterium]